MRAMNSFQMQASQLPQPAILKHDESADELHTCTSIPHVLHDGRVAVHTHTGHQSQWTDAVCAQALVGSQQPSLTLLSPLMQSSGNAKLATLKADEPQTAFRLHPGLVAATAPQASPIIAVQHQDGAAATHGQMFSALPMHSNPSQMPSPSPSIPANTGFSNATHLNNAHASPHDFSSHQNGGPASHALDGLPLADLSASQQGSLASQGGMGTSPAGSLQSDVSSASAMYRRLRASGQPIIRQGSLGPAGSMDSAQSARIAEHLNIARARNASLGPSPMEGVEGPGPAVYNPALLMSPEFQSESFSKRGRVINDTGSTPGGALPAASGKTIVADPSAGDAPLRPAAHVVRPTDSPLQACNCQWQACC